MVIFSSSVFMSRFNNSIVKRTKSFSVPVSKFSKEILALFYKEGYIFSYFLDSQKNSFVVYPNHKVVTFRLVLYSKPSRKLNFKHFYVRKKLNSGKFFVLKTCFGFQFSDFARFNKVGGQPIFILNYFLCLPGSLICSSQFLLVFWKFLMLTSSLTVWVILFLFLNL